MTANTSEQYWHCQKHFRLRNFVKSWKRHISGYIGPAVRHIGDKKSLVSRFDIQYDNNFQIPHITDAKSQQLLSRVSQNITKR